MKSSEIATVFVDFYKNRGFEVLPQAPLMDSSIPMSFVMSAGLVQIERSLSKSRIEKRDKYVLVQKCFRHFDIEKVGTDGIHLSFLICRGHSFLETYALKPPYKPCGYWRLIY